MITVPELAADALGEFLANYMRRRFGSSQAPLVEMVPSIARIAIECIGNSDALYHNVEHTMLVTLAGHDILRGRALHTHMPAEDYAHVIIACLTHDIGYVRGVFREDDQGRLSGRPRRPQGDAAARILGRGAVALPCRPLQDVRHGAPRGHHVAGQSGGSRSPSRARDFPSSFPSEGEECDEEAALLRAADLIGQLGDPHYIRKANALYHEFEEAGLNRQLGYSSPADLVNLYPQFYWNSVAPHVQTAIRYLNVTSSGRQWIANLYSNVFRAERDISLSGPQK